MSMYGGSNASDVTYGQNLSYWEQIKHLIVGK